MFRFESNFFLISETKLLRNRHQQPSKLWVLGSNPNRITGKNRSGIDVSVSLLSVSKLHWGWLYGTLE